MVILENYQYNNAIRLSVVIQGWGCPFTPCAEGLQLRCGQKTTIHTVIPARSWRESTFQSTLSFLHDLGRNPLFNPHCHSCTILAGIHFSIHTIIPARSWQESTFQSTTKNMQFKMSLLSPFGGAEVSPCRSVAVAMCGFSRGEGPASICLVSAVSKDRRGDTARPMNRNKTIYAV